MSSDVLVSFGGDTKNLRDQIDSAQQSVDENISKMKNSADAASPAFARLQESIDKLNESAEKTASSAATIEMYQTLAFYLRVASGTADVLTGSIGYTYEGVKLLGQGVGVVASGIASLTSQFLEYARSQAYMAQYLPVVRVENEGVIASIGRASLAWNDHWRSVEIAKSGLVEITGATIAASGGMARFTAAASHSGLHTASYAIQSYMEQLAKIPGMSNDVASSILASFGSIPTSSAPLLQTLVGITTQMSASKEQAQVLAEQLSRAMTDPASSGEAFLASQRDITAELLKQFDTAKRSGDVGKMQAVIVQEMIAKERSALNEKNRALKEQLHALESMGPLGRLLELSYKTQVDEANKAVDALNKQITALDAAAAKMRQMPIDMNQAALAARNIVNALSPLSLQLETINGKLSSMRQVFGGFGGSLKGATGDAKELLRYFEGFRDKAYWDKNAFRVGYGSDTTTRADGSVERVTADTIVTREDAERDLARRIVEFQDAAAAKIGGSWEGLSDRAKASITSVVYNYGAASPALDKMYTAAGTGSDKLIADAIRELKANPDRRYQEAANITNSSPGSNLASGLPATRADIEAMAKLKDEAQAVEDAMRGGNAVAQAQAQILSRSAAGEKDSVRDAQQLVEAWKTDLSTAHSTTAQVQMQNGLRAAQVSLAERILEVERSKLGVSGADDRSARDKLETATKLYEIETRAAGQDVALKNAALTKKKSAETAYEQEITRLAQESENSRFAILMMGIEQQKAKIREDLQSHRLTNRQKLDADLALEAEQTRIETEHYQRLRDLEYEGTVAYQHAQNRMTLIAAESAARRQQIMLQDGKKIQQEYDRTFNQIKSTLTSSIMGMIQGTTTLRQLFQNVALQIVQTFVKAGVDLVANWASSQARILLATVTGQSQQTAAVAAGTSARLATQTAGSTAGAAVEKASAMATISGDAAKAAAGAYSAVAGIPIIGPVLAPAAAAVAFGAVTAFGSFDTGSWSIPHDQLAMVHAGEMIVPSRGGVAEEFRSVLSGDGHQQGSSSTHAHFHVNGIDQGSVRSFFKNNSRQILSALDGAVKNGNHLGLRRLGG